MKIAILAGGRGTRLGLSDRPKPMVPIGGKPLLERLVEDARARGFGEFVFLTGHLSEVIEQHFGDGSRFGVSIAHVREKEPLGTAGAVRDARAHFDEPFILLYGDTLIDVDFAHMAGFHRDQGGAATLFVHPNDHPFDSDLVVVDGKHQVKALLPSPHSSGDHLRNLVSAALYVLDPSAIDHVPATGAFDWGKDIFPAMLTSGARINAYRSLEYVKDIGTPERLARGEQDLASGKVSRLSRRQAKPAIFLDRDGILNEERNGVHSPEALTLMPDAAEALRAINKAGIPAICVTNQPDVAKGMVTPQALETIFAALDGALGEKGAYLDDLYHCPHHPESGWPGEVAELKISCDCRKPEPGMLLRAAEEHRLDLSRSWMIGDRHVDMAAAHRAGARGILVQTGHAGSDAAGADGTPDHIAPTLKAAVDYILEAMT